MSFDDALREQAELLVKRAESSARAAAATAAHNVMKTHLSEVAKHYGDVDYYAGELGNALLGDKSLLDNRRSTLVGLVVKALTARIIR